MTFPFNHQTPTKDLTKVLMDIVETRTFKEMESLLKYLEEEGVINLYGIRPDHCEYHAFDVDLVSRKKKSFSFVGLHVKAEQVYHGARLFHHVDDFIRYRQSLRLN